MIRLILLDINFIDKMFLEILIYKIDDEKSEIWNKNGCKFEYIDH